jgi:hypothetical protein
MNSMKVLSYVFYFSLAMVVLFSLVCNFENLRLFGKLGKNSIDVRVNYLDNNNR